MRSPKDQLPTFLTIGEVADQLSLSQKTIRRCIDRGHLRAHRLAGRIRLSAEDVAAFIGARRG